MSMINIGLVSDLHTEFWHNRQERRVGGLVRERLATADIILLPGDIGAGADGIAMARRLFPDKPVFMVAGNHEFYQGDYARVLDDLRAAATDNIHFLHMDVGTITVHDTPIRIIGTTLWTDFALHSTPDLSLLDAQRGLNDFRVITYDGHTLTPQDTLDWHKEQRVWINDRLDEVFEGITILMTHHAPCSFAIGPRFVGDRLSPCFASRMEGILLQDDLPLVVWGHTHHCIDRTIERTRFVSNQTGYASYIPPTETGEFGQIIELATSRESDQGDTEPEGDEEG
jgi:predicted phosphodiesterase